jgi:hypothetical protein
MSRCVEQYVSPSILGIFLIIGLYLVAAGSLRVGSRKPCAIVFSGGAANAILGQVLSYTPYPSQDDNPGLAMSGKTPK